LAPRPLGRPRPGSSGSGKPPRAGRQRPDRPTGSAPAARDGRGRRAADGQGAEAQRPRAPAEKRRAAPPGSGANAPGRTAKAAGRTAKAPGRTAKQARRRDQLEVARAAARPGPDRELIEGRRPVIEALRSGRPVDRVLVATGSTGGTVAELSALARDRGVPVETVPRSVIDAEAQTGAHQGVLAVVAPIEPIGLDQLLAVPLATTEPPFFLALDGVEDPRNLGALARSADAAGCHGLIVPRHRSAPLSAVAVKSSAGALAHLPVAEVPNLTRALDRLRESGLWCVGLDSQADADLFDLDLATEPVCVVVGSEGAGLHRLVREACDVVVRIPMTGHVESLNASVAGALALFEVRRRRTRTSTRPPAPQSTTPSS
jgi:23S rRNA (guanosine2251-2'-O)-methyltransferase